MSNNLLTPVDALIYLGLWVPGSKTAPNTHYLKILFDDGHLKRVEMNSRVFRYPQESLDELKQKIADKIVTLSF